MVKYAIIAFEHCDINNVSTDEILLKNGNCDSLIFNDRSDDMIVYCPFCQKNYDNSDYGFMIDDYCDMPMIWCDCGAEYILLPSTARVLAKNKTCNLFSSANEDFTFVEYRCAFIKKIITAELTEYYPTKNIDVKPTKEELKFLKQCIIKNSMEDAILLIEKYGICKIEDEGEFIQWCQEIPLTFAEDVNDYNISSDFEFRHDGCYAFIVFEDENGVEKRMRVWGD